MHDALHVLQRILPVADLRLKLANEGVPEPLALGTIHDLIRAVPVNCRVTGYTISSSAIKVSELRAQAPRRAWSSADAIGTEYSACRPDFRQHINDPVRSGKRRLHDALEEFRRDVDASEGDPVVVRR